LFIKEKFMEEYKYNPGKIVTAQGRIRKPALQAMRAMFQEVESTASSPVKPLLYVYPDAMAARGNEHIGSLNAALYDLATALPILWIPAGATPALESNIPILYPDGSVIPQNENLSRLLRQVPAVDTEARSGWIREVTAELTGAKQKALPLSEK
jgi:hypothetical protein